LENYRFDDYSQQLYGFIWNEFCDWYVEMAKLRLYGNEPKEQARIRQMLVFLLDQILRLLHPAMPFLTEELWQVLKRGQGSIMVQPYPKTEPEWIQPEVEERVGFLTEVIRAIRNLRTEIGCPPSKEVKVILFGTEQNLAFLRSQEPYLRTLARTGSVEYLTKGQRPKGAATAVVGDTELYIPLGDMIDPNEEKKRLEKEVRKVEEELARVQKKLSNKEFLAKAKEEVVRKEREKAEQFEDKIRTLNRSLERIQEIQQVGGES
jgi:valyl-tRNA synthetase